MINICPISIRDGDFFVFIENPQRLQLKLKMDGLTFSSSVGGEFINDRYEYYSLHIRGQHIDMDIILTIDEYDAMKQLYPNLV